MNFFLLRTQRSHGCSQFLWAKSVCGDGCHSSAAVQWLSYTAVICL